MPWLRAVTRTQPGREMYFNLRAQLGGRDPGAERGSEHWRCTERPARLQCTKVCSVTGLKPRRRAWTSF